VDRGHDPVLAARQPPQHLARRGLVNRLPEDHFVDQHQGVGGEDPIAGMARRGDRCLLPGKTDRRIRTALRRGDGFVDIGRTDRERDAEVREDLGPARGGGREDEGRYG
jgi:hypothetical protein